VHESGRRDVIGLDIGEIESEAYWVAFPRSRREQGVRLCVSDEHSRGARDRAGAHRQRCAGPVAA